MGVVRRRNIDGYGSAMALVPIGFGDTSVNDYRIYVMDREGRVSGPSEIVTCNTDEEAVEHARQFLDDMPVEIWLGAKRVGRLDPEK